jgi:hypothetical protein
MSSWISIQRRPVRVFKQPVEENKNDVSSDLIKPQNVIDTSVKYYIAGGKLGDFIYQLSVIKYNYDNFGKKGVLYLANIGDKFTFSLEKTYEDTKDIILSQQYIKDYRIYNNEKYDINLSNWRNNIKELNELNWIQLYKKTFDIDWAKSRWLEDIETDSTLNNTILISHSLMRHNDNINFNFIKELKEKNIIVYFICFDINEYNNFILKYNINIPLILCNSIKEMIIKINSCKMLIGNLSSPLAISLALHKKCIGILPTALQHYYSDVKLNSNLNLSFYNIVNNDIELRNLL